MNREEIKAMIKDYVYSEDGITYMSDKQYNNCINIIEQLRQENKQLKKHIEKYERYCKTTGIEELIKNKKYKEVIDKAIEYIESKNNGHCIINGEEKGAFTFILNFDAGREFIWKLLDILKGVE